MFDVKYKIFPLSENAVSIDFGNTISREINQIVVKLNALVNQKKFPGFIETVSAFSSVTIFFDHQLVRKSVGGSGTAFKFVEDFIKRTILLMGEMPIGLRRSHLIGVDYSPEFAPDLPFLSQYAKLSREEIIAIHTSVSYHVYMIGFLPGFAYLGEVDSRIAVPRLTTPHGAVAAGSVGIAGHQTGIYPLKSPGGWQIIGKTNVPMFCPDEKEITFLRVGDSVRFYDIKV